MLTVGNMCCSDAIVLFTSLDIPSAFFSISLIQTLTGPTLPPEWTSLSRRWWRLQRANGTEETPPTSSIWTMFISIQRTVATIDTLCTLGCEILAYQGHNDVFKPDTCGSQRCSIYVHVDPPHRKSFLPVAVKTLQFLSSPDRLQLWQQMQMAPWAIFGLFWGSFHFTRRRLRRAVLLNASFSLWLTMFMCGHSGSWVCYLYPSSLQWSITLCYSILIRP